MPAATPASWRAIVASSLDWHEAHATFDDAVADLPQDVRGRRPHQFPHSSWELVEHIRRTQADILEFCLNPAYKELDWPADYWPPSAAPPSPSAWEDSVAAVVRDRHALETLAGDPAIDLFARIPHGSGQTYLRELLLVADHTAYHVGQLVAARQALGAWK